MGKIFCVEFQRVPLKFHTKYLTHTLKDVDFIQSTCSNLPEKKEEKYVSNTQQNIESVIL